MTATKRVRKGGSAATPRKAMRRSVDPEARAAAWPPALPACPHCEATGPLDSHDQACPYRVRTEAYFRSVMEREEAARAARAAEPEQEQDDEAHPALVEHDDTADSSAEEDSRIMARLTKNTDPAEVADVKGLRDLAAMLKIDGRSGLKTRYELESAIVSAQRAAAKASGEPKAKGEKRQAPERPVLDEYDAGDGIVFKPGVKVEVVRDVNLSKRTSGFTGIVPAGATGKVTAIRGAGGPNGGAQIEAEIKDVGTVAIGARHFVTA